MAYRISITEVAERQFHALSAREQRVLEAAIESRLQHQPTTPTRAVKQLRPILIADYELRTGNLRALYNVEADEVVIILVGRKVGNQLIVEGEAFHGHQDHSDEPAGDGVETDPA